MNQMDLRSAIVEVSVDGRIVCSTALGESAAAAPATTDMHFRNGAIAMTYMPTVLLQLVDETRLSPDDKLGKWLPDLPAADRVTLEMLLNNTSGYPDYVADPEFIAATKANPDRNGSEALMFAIARQMAPDKPVPLSEFVQ